MDLKRRPHSIAVDVADKHYLHLFPGVQPLIVSISVYSKYLYPSLGLSFTINFISNHTILLL